MHQRGKVVCTNVAKLYAPTWQSCMHQRDKVDPGLTSFGSSKLLIKSVTMKI